MSRHGEFIPKHFERIGKLKGQVVNFQMDESIKPLLQKERQVVSQERSIKKNSQNACSSWKKRRSIRLNCWTINRYQMQWLPTRKHWGRSGWEWTCVMWTWTNWLIFQSCWFKSYDTSWMVLHVSAKSIRHMHFIKWD